jgi:hypothetical protein
MASGIGGIVVSVGPFGSWFVVLFLGRLLIVNCSACAKARTRCKSPTVREGDMLNREQFRHPYTGVSISPSLTVGLLHRVRRLCSEPTNNEQRTTNNDQSLVYVESPVAISFPSLFATSAVTVKILLPARTHLAVHVMVPTVCGRR